MTSRSPLNIEEINLIKIWSPFNCPFSDFNASLDSMMARDVDGRFKCLTCGKTMAAKKDLRRHAETHLDILHPCGICPERSFKSRSSLANHYSVYHKGQVQSPWNMT